MKFLIMPKVYYYKGSMSDRDWIESRMVEIPESKRPDIADEYERRFNSGEGRNRKAANTYLNSVALEYRQETYNAQRIAI